MITVSKPLVNASVIALMACGLALTIPLVKAQTGTQSKTQNQASQKTATIKQLPIDDVRRFSAAITQIKRYYVKPVEDKKLFENAIRGMLNGLDPHSSYLDASDFSELQSSTRGEFSGLGIEVTMDNGLIKVISPIDDTPAAKAGVQAGDYIVKLDETPVKGMSLRDAVNRMRGKRGSSIDLLVVRKGVDKPLKFKVVREVITIQSVKSKLLDDYYGYIRISHFQNHTARDLKTAVEKLRKQSNNQLRGLILDMRNNPGGLLEAAIETSDAFIHNDRKGKEELIVYTEGRIPGSKFRANATPGDIMNKAPIIVLINGGSASGSEIVAGALQDNKRAIIMGTKSFGKGSVQTVLPLDGKRGVKLTTALYYTPAGRSIQAKGVKPDIVVDAINIPKPEADKIAKMGLVKEADLVGHLDNDKDKSANSKAKKGNQSKDAKLKKHSASLYDDYQLHVALNMLKGLALKKQ